MYAGRSTVVDGVANPHHARQVGHGLLYFCGIVLHYHVALPFIRLSRRFFSASFKTFSSSSSGTGAVRIG